MDRRDSLKALAVGTLSVSALLSGCDTKKSETKSPAAAKYGRTPEEAARDAALMEKTFFTEPEMAAITVLCDIIIPADEHSGSASDAGVPEFIEFIVKDQPAYQTPLRGGLRWLDIQSLKRYENIFVNCSEKQQLELIDLIAYPEKAPRHMQAGAAFFSTMRNLTATGFFTTKMGIEDIGYAGNKPNAWDGVPKEVLEQYGLEYDEKTLAQCLKNEDRGKIMTWDEEV